MKRYLAQTAGAVQIPPPTPSFLKGGGAGVRIPVPPFKKGGPGGISREAGSWILLIFFLLALPLQAQDLDRGKQVYDKWCAHCHGETGDGEGVAASRLNPKPRDFTAGKYKIRMTTTGNLPTDQDLENAVRNGLPYSSMPAFPANFIPDGDLDALVAYVKSFSPDFADPELADPESIAIPQPPPYDGERAQTEGRKIYEETGCARCHGNLGRGDGMSAPTLVDDWGHPIRVADLTMPWTFRGGGTRRDIFRTMSTGFNGTPMPGFHDNLGATPEESRQRMWAIVDYMLSLSGGPAQGEKSEAPYGNLLTAVGTDEELDVARGKELFAGAPATLFPIVGQIMEPGRNFYPSASAIRAQAVYNDDEIAFLLTWHDMRAETSGANAPDLAVPLWDDQLAAAGQPETDKADDAGDFWGTGEEEEEDAGGDFWGAEEEEDAGDDFWGDGEDEEPAGPTGPDTELSDAVALQFPLAMPTGVRRPYFIFGDAQNPVDLWFRDLGAGEGSNWVGRGSAAVTPSDVEPPETWTRYEDGEWAVIFKRRRKGRGAISFEQDTFVPIAFSVWDGFNRERGNKRGLTGWRHVYLQPLEEPAWQWPVARAGLGVLALELLIIGLVRRRSGKAEAGAAPHAAGQTA